MLKGLLRLTKPSEGRIYFNESLRMDEVGYLPQQTAAHKDFPASAREVVLSGCAGRRGYMPFYTAAERRTATEHMKQLDIYTLRDTCYRELSGGQQQRVLLARALCAARKLLLLDEPVAGLDMIASRELYRRIAAVNRDTRLTVVMVTHDLNAALPYASHVLQLDKKQTFYGTTAEYTVSGVGDALLGVG